MRSRVKVGIVGCGKISDQYFLGCRQYDILEVVACADLDVERAKAKAAEHGVQRACTVDELLRADDIEIVVNLTVPQAHVAVNERILRAGKHVYVEKPFALDAAEGARVLALADERGLLVGCAPDTFLGGGIQTARQAIDEGRIGVPVSAMAFMLSHGHESWHPAPEFYYKAGGGPMFDMGPYYLTALVALLGPIARVTGSVRTTFPERTITSAPLAGTKIRVDVPTHHMGVLDFVSGATASITTSFDVWPYPMPRILIFGTESTLEVPDPNTFAGPVRLRSKDGARYDEIPLTHTDQRGRGTGVADMAYALRFGRSHRATGRLANHVVEAMQAFETASLRGSHVLLRNTCERPTALPAGLPLNQLDGG